MSMSNSVAQTTALPWGVSQNQMHEAVDLVIDEAQNVASNVAILTLPLVVASGGSALKTGINTSLPMVVSPIATPLIDRGVTASVVLSGTPQAHELVRTTVQEIGNVAKAAVHASIDSSVGLSTRSISLVNI